VDREAALAELTRRYFASRGPATLNDFARWSSLTAAQGREGLTLVANELESEVIDGKTYWFAAPLPRASASTKPRVDLVQGYDEIIMSYNESRDASFTPVDSRLLHAVLLRGRMIGKWKPVAQRNSVVLKTVLSRALTRVERDALGAAIHAYTSFAGVPLTVARKRGK
jgi:winged helix DNA-binding protein